MKLKFSWGEVTIENVCDWSNHRFSINDNHCSKCGLPMSIFNLLDAPNDVREQAKQQKAFFVPDMTPRFNLGLGEVCCGTRDAEKKAKKRGLIPVGDTPVDKLNKPEPIKYREVLVEGLKQLRAGKRIV